jgi:uncharacterized iron-regulated protein
VARFPQTILRFCLPALGALAVAAAAPAQAQTACAAVGEWSLPGGIRIAAPEILVRAAHESVVLLGESHDNADHHRWQLQTIAALAALQPRLVLSFEMFPRRVQGVLDRWVAGELSEEEFLAASDWRQVWGTEASLYLPLFHFARLNRIPMVALNVERDLVRTVGAKGAEAVPADKREGISDPEPASEAYLDLLFTVYSEHGEKGRVRARSDPEFRRFVEAQLVWDRAMAQALAEAAARNPGALIIGIMGGAHIARGYGVPHQLASLGVTRIASLLPWDLGTDCGKLTSGFATAVFGLSAARPVPPRPLLGIAVETTSDGVKISAVNAGSIAEAAGLLAGDVLIEVAGTVVKVPEDVRAIVFAMRPGTWLPLKAKRQGEVVELTAKFPPAKR